MKIPPTMPPLDDWVVIPVERIEELAVGSRMRDGHEGHAFDGAVERPGGKNFYRTAAEWRAAGRDPFFMNLRGDLGELVYEMTTGLVMDERIVRGGIKGADFKDGINVKHTPFIHPTTCLIIEPDLHRKHTPRVGYALVGLGRSRRGIVGCVLGWASNRMVDNSERVDYGYGLKHSIHHTKLKRPDAWLKGGCWP